MPLLSGASTTSNRNQETALPHQARGYRPVILSLQNISSETQAQSRLVVLRRGLSGKGARWHRSAYPLSSLLPCLPRPIFGGTAGFDPKPACRMHAKPLTSARTAFGDTSVNVQEGSR